jgi:hypothetical protein
MDESGRFLVKANANNNLAAGQAMSGPNAEGYWQARK